MINGFNQGGLRVKCKVYKLISSSTTIGSNKVFIIYSDEDDFSSFSKSLIIVRNGMTVKITKRWLVRKTDEHTGEGSNYDEVVNEQGYEYWKYTKNWNKQNKHNGENTYWWNHGM